MWDEGVPDERGGDQVDEIASPAACAANPHDAATRDAYRMHAEPRRCCRSGLRDDECCDSYGNGGDAKSPGAKAHDLTLPSRRRDGREHRFSVAAAIELRTRVSVSAAPTATPEGRPLLGGAAQ